MGGRFGQTRQSSSQPPGHLHCSLLAVELGRPPLQALGHLVDPVDLECVRVQLGLLHQEDERRRTLLGGKTKGHTEKREDKGERLSYLDHVTLPEVVSSAAPGKWATLGPRSSRTNHWKRS